MVSSILLLALTCLPGRIGFAAPPTVQELVDQFSPTNYLNVISNKLYTRAGMNRAPVQVGGAEHDLCRDAIYDEFLRAGLSPYKDPFTYQDTVGPTWVNVCNVIAVKEGVQNPNNEIYVVGSHYDSRENPGADDNATGVGCQLEMARIFARQHFAKTIVFAIFDSEERYEVGTGAHRLGSLRYVGQHPTDNIKGMISVDMIGWQAPSPNSNRASVRGRDTFSAIRSDLIAALQTYGSGLVGVVSTSENMSDHWAFAEAGMPACCLIEYNYPGNSRYHTANDYVEAPGYLDWGYLEKMCKGVIGYYATKLQPVDVTPQLLSCQPTNTGLLIHASGLPRCQYAVDLCTNLLAPVWLAIGTNSASATDGAWIVLDSQAAGRPFAFYRARFVTGYVGGGGAAPQIATQPLHRVVDSGGSVSLAVTATGDAPLSYQWRFNGSAVPGATSNPYTIPAAQSTDAGDYSVVVANFSGSVTSRIASLTVYPPQTVAFADELDTDSSANWTVSKSSADTRCTFNYDYSADGIPSAPHSTVGSTRGVKYEANIALGVVAAVSMSPLGQSFGGDYRLRFDMWINANGPFPLGGQGSSQYLTAGLGTTGGHVQWTGAGTVDGCWFAVDGEGQSGDTSAPADYNAYASKTMQSAASGVYAAGTDSNARGNNNPYYRTAFPGGQTPPASQQSAYPAQQTGALEAGAVGFAWRDVIIAKRGNIVEWSVDGVKLATFTSASVTASNVFVGYWDPWTSVSPFPALSFGLVDNVRVEVSTDTAPPSDIIIDNPASTVVGTAWITNNTATDRYGADYIYTSTKGSGTAYVEYRPTLQASGNYAVYEWHSVGGNRTTDARIDITHSAGTQTVTVNQQFNGGQWNQLGTFNFAAGSAGSVRIKDNFTTYNVVIADAVKFVYVP